MKKRTVVLICLLCLIIGALGGYIAVDKFNIGNKTSNEENTNVDEANKEKSESKKEVSSNIEKIKINKEYIFKILSITDLRFDSMDELTDEDLIRVAIFAVFEDYEDVIPNLPKDNEGKYSEELINQIAYSFFGKEISKHQSIEIAEYSEGYYHLEMGDGDPIPEAFNIEESKKGNDIVYLYDEVLEANIGIIYSGEKYEVVTDSNGFVKSRKLVNDKLFEKTESMKMEKGEASRDYNYIVAVLKLGEDTFKTEQKDGYFTFSDANGKTHEIKEYTGITVELSNVADGDDQDVQIVTLNYKDKDGNEVNKENNINTVDVKIKMSKDYSEYSVVK